MHWKVQYRSILVLYISTECFQIILLKVVDIDGIMFTSLMCQSRIGKVSSSSVIFFLCTFFTQMVIIRQFENLDVKIRFANFVYRFRENASRYIVPVSESKCPGQWFSWISFLKQRPLKLNSIKYLKIV